MSAPRAHRRQTVGGRAPKQVQQDGLSLIISGVAGGHVRRQGTESCRAGSRLEVGARADRHPVDDELNAECRRHIAHDLGILLGTGAQTVIDVMGDGGTVRHDGQHQKRKGVGAARHRTGKRRSLVGKRAAPDEPGGGP